MIVLRLYNDFSKNKKSTKKPDANTYSRQVNAILKNATSVKAPVFVIDTNQEGFVSASLHMFNYLYWEELGRYYFINDIVQFRNNIIEFHCTCDVLATYRQTIIDSTQFIVASSVEVDDDIVDTRQVPASTPIILKTSGSNVLPNSNPCAIANIIAEDYTTSIISGGVSQYIFDTLGSFTSFLNKCFHMYENVELETAFKLYMTGTSVDSILKATVFPYTPDIAGKKTAMIGAYDTGIETSYTLTKNVSRSQTLKIPWFDNKKRYRCNTYYKAQLYIPFVGVIGLDINDISKSDYITLNYVLDNVNGSFICTVVLEGIQRYIFEGSLGSEVQFGTVTNNPVQGYLDIASGVGSLLKGNLSGALGSVVDGVGEFTRADTSVIGNYNSNVSIEYTSQTPVIVLYYYQPQSSDVVKYRGNLFCHSDNLKNHVGGYIETENAHFEIRDKSFIDELENVCVLLDTGVFLE